MKLVKTSAIALTLSAMLAGPVLAQGAGSTTPPSGMTQQGGAMQRGPAGGAGTELNAQAPGAKAGAATKGTVGSGSGAARGTAGATGKAAPEAAPNGLDPGGAASTTKRH
jgi:hypothetical protein